ncbi:MAG: tetratricopeptide repeat protein [Flavobacteriales bacterium]|nr:tetratricopeptide repeat protein [Flavobacteriales bacterium]
MPRASLLLFLLLLLSATLRATEPDPLDSLWRAYRDPKLSAREHLTTFHLIIYELRSMDVDSSAALATEMLRQAREQNDTLMIALAYRDLGLAALMKRSTDTALTHLTTALGFYAALEDSAGYRGAGAALSSMGMAHKNAGRMEEAMEHYRRSIAMHHLANDEEGIVYCYNGIGRIQQIQGQYDSALVNYGKVAALAAKLGMAEMEGAGYGNMANVSQDMGRIGEAIDLAYRSLAIMERLGNDRGTATCLTTVSGLKYALGEDEESLALLHRAYGLYKKVDYRQGMMTSGSSIGGMLLEMDRPDSAIHMLEVSLGLERESNAKDLMGRTLRELGSAYRKTRRLKEAGTILDEALVLARELKDAPGEANTLAHLGRLALDEGRAAQAVDRCTEGRAIALAHEAFMERRENCECLYLAYKARGEGLAALRYHEEFIATRDSMATEKSARELTQRDLLYTFGKQQLADSLRYASERMVLERERTIESMRADQNSNRAWATGGGALLLLSGAGAWFVSDRKRRQERFEKEAATLETQALRSQMNPHFIFNALNSINAFVQRNDQDSASSYLGKFARVMRSVLENSRHAEVSLSEDLEALRGYMDLERMRMDKKFDFTVEVDPGLDPEEVMVPPLVVQPFVENAIWHGMAGKEGQGHIRLKVEAREKQLLWIIEDDGAGRHAKKTPLPEGTPTTAVKKTSLGTTITRARLDLVQKQHGGKAGFKYVDLPQGTRVEVDMPLMYAH